MRPPGPTNNNRMQENSHPANAWQHRTLQPVARLAQSHTGRMVVYLTLGTRVCKHRSGKRCHHHHLTCGWERLDLWRDRGAVIDCRTGQGSALGGMAQRRRRCVVVHFTVGASLQPYPQCLVERADRRCPGIHPGSLGPQYVTRHREPPRLTVDPNCWAEPTTAVAGSDIAGDGRLRLALAAVVESRR